MGDLQVPGLLHAAYVRSAHAHGRLLAVQADAAPALPGVVAVFTKVDLAGLALPAVNALIQPAALAAGTLLGGSMALAVGAPLARVVARSPAAARQAADRLAVDTDDLPPQLDSSPAPALATVRWATGALPERPATAQVQIGLPRVAPAPLEPRAALMHWSGGPGADHLLAWCSTQTLSRARQMPAALLGLPINRVQVVAPDVGGAFGGKAAIGPEELLLAHAARRLGAPQRWLATRMEDLASAPHGRAWQAQGGIWLAADGAVEAIEADFSFQLGHWLTYSARVPARNAARIVPGPYRVGTVATQARCPTSHAAAVGIYRGAGRPEAAILLERLIDEAARQTGQDPLALRRRQVWPPAPPPRARIARPAMRPWPRRCWAARRPTLTCCTATPASARPPSARWPAAAPPSAAVRCCAPRGSCASSLTRAPPGPVRW